MLSLNNSLEIVYHQILKGKIVTLAFYQVLVDCLRLKKLHVKNAPNACEIAVLPTAASPSKAHLTKMVWPKLSKPIFLNEESALTIQ